MPLVGGLQLLYHKMKKEKHIDTAAFGCFILYVCLTRKSSLVHIVFLLVSFMDQKSVITHTRTDNPEWHFRCQHFFSTIFLFVSFVQFRRKNCHNFRAFLFLRVKELTFSNSVFP